MKQLLIAIVCLMHGFLFAQYEAANWYFGENAGINFNANTGVVTALPNGRLNTKEGSSSISDQNGNLLFYTDGITVYNKDHNVMDNGNGLYGNPSSTQSAIVVPKPKSSDIFYIFTVGSSALGSANYGFNYSVVDITKNGGLGQVTRKNINLLAYSSEKISAVVQDCSTQSIWVITLSTTTGTYSSFDPLNTYYAYEITATAVNTTPVKSTFTTSISDPRGALKFSPDGTKMVSANMDNGLFLYDFQTTTGVVSNQRRLAVSTVSSNKPYGAEFSSNNQFLYIHASNDYNQPDSYITAKHRSALIQYDLEAINISDSQVVLDDRNLFRGALQLGPDGKIYRALAASYQQGLPYLGVIENPNAKGAAARYRHNAIGLAGKNSTQGLPPFIQSFFNQKIDIIHASDGIATNTLALCTGDTYILEATETPGATYDWTFNGTLITPLSDPWKLEVSAPGYYKVIITPPSSTICDISEGEAHVSYFGIPIAHTTTPLNHICDAGNDGIETVNLTVQDTSILGSQDPSEFKVNYFETKIDADLNENIIATPSRYLTRSNNQEIFARVENINNSNCFATTSFQITLIATPNLNVQNISRCDVSAPYNDGLSVFNLEDSIVSSSASVSFYETNPVGTTTPTSISNPIHFTNSQNNQTIYARAINHTTGCYTDHTFTLTVTDAPETFEIAYFCTGSTVTLNTSISGIYTYQWLENNTPISGAVSDNLTVDHAGDFSLVITDSATNCVEIEHFNVEESGVANITDVKVTDVSENNSVTVTTSGLGTYEYALFKEDIAYKPYQTSNIFTNVQPGIYTLKVKDVKNNCGITESTVNVIGFPKFFTPNNDGYHDTWQIEGTSDMFQPQSKVLIYNRYGKLVKEITPLGDGWDGTLNGSPLPADDYWFSAFLQDGRTFKSHFTLKR